MDLDNPRLIPPDLKSWITTERVTGDIPGDLARKAETPLSTEPPISERDLLNPVFDSVESLKTGWFAILSTSSKSSVEDFELLTKAVSNIC